MNYHNAIKFCYLLIVLITVFSCNHKSIDKTINNKMLISNSVICATLNYFVNDTMIEEFKQCNRFIDKAGCKVLLREDSLKIVKLDSLFTKVDLDFIFQQDLYSIHYKHNECLKGKNLIPGDTLLKFNNLEFWKEFHKRYGKGGFCSISLPLFSKDLNIVIIKYSFSYGRVWGSGGTFIFKKMGSKWVNIFCLNSWMS